MPDFGIGEAIAAITAIGSEIGADVGAGAAALGSGIADVGAAGLGAAEAGLGALGTGAADVASGVGGGLESLFGGTAGTLGGAAGAADPLAAAAAGAAPTVAGGAAPVGAGAIDLASSVGAGGADLTGLGADVSAFAPTEIGGTGAFPITAGATQDVLNLGTAESVLPFGSTGGADIAGAATSGGLTGGGASGITGGLGDIAGAAGGAGGGAGGDVAGILSAGKTAAGGGGILDSLGSGALASLTKNPLGIAAAGAGLGYNILQGQKLTANQQALTGIAQQEAGAGLQLQSYLNTGTLPPGMQAQVDNAKAAAKAQIISGYASKGMSADPSQNSALAQELAAVDTNALELQGKIATNLLTAGINETNMSGSLFQALIQMDQTQAKQMGSAIANFASALAGGPKSITIGGSASA